MPVASVLAPTNAVIPPFSSTAVAPTVTRAQSMASIVDRVRTLVKPFAVDVVTARPAAARTRSGAAGDVQPASTTQAASAHDLMFDMVPRLPSW